MTGKTYFTYKRLIWWEGWKLLVI